MKKSTLANCVLAAALLASGSVFASTSIDFDGSNDAPNLNTDFQTQAFSLNFGAPTAAFSFNGFDSTLGTLVGVDVYLTVNHETLISYASVLTGGAGFATNASSTGSLTVTGSNGLSVNDSSLSTNPFTGGVNGFYTQLGTSSLASSVVDKSDLDPSTGLSAYTGPVTLNLTNATLQSGTCVFPTSCGTNGSADGTITLNYDYIAKSNNVPEPASLALISAGLLGLGAIRRKKATQA